MLMKFVKRDSGEVSPEFLAECSRKFDITAVILEQIILRGNDTIEKITEFLNPSQKSFRNAFDLKGMAEFVQRIKKAQELNERVLIFGDYDVDGVSATAIMIKTLKMLGINAKFYLPNRYVDGYGLTNEVIKKIRKKYNPQLIITVDCGISCHDEVEFAKSLGIEILITDHHEIPEILPETIVLNAKIPNQNYQFNGLCGTGLAYKISQALVGDKSEEFLPIACIATIADIVPLVDENRAIVHFGLKKLKMLPNGIKMLFKNLGININKCTTNEISFKVAPKLNASGRMGDAKDSLKLYLSESITEIRKLIDKILNHNNNRRDLCSLVESDCGSILSKVNLSGPSIILSSKDWDQGILGIICAKLVAQYNRPVFLFSEVDGEMKGSARSIRGINIHSLLSSMKDILETFGGHPIAAGLTLKSDNFDQFITRVNEYLLEKVSPDVFIPQELYDVEVSLADINNKFYKDLQKLEPCGSENEALKLFMKTDSFSFSPMKKYYCHCNIKVGNKLSLVNFNCSDDYAKIKIASELKIIFELQNDSYSNSLKGVVKSLDCEIATLKNVSKMEIIPFLEQIKYVNNENRATYTLFTPSEKSLEMENYFGTAIVVNSDTAYNRLMQYVEIEKIGKVDVCNGKENSGINCVFFYPPNIEFARSYNKIIFLDAVSDSSYIAQINQISKAQVYLPNEKISKKYFKNLNISRENFGLIFKDLEKSAGDFNSLLEIFLALKKKKKIVYSYREFYAAYMVFCELGIIKVNSLGECNSFSIDQNVQSELKNSKIYSTLTYMKN